MLSAHAKVPLCYQLMSPKGHPSRPKPVSRLALKFCTGIANSEARLGGSWFNPLTKVLTVAEFPIPSCIMKQVH